MNKTRKIDILHKRAHGQYVDVTAEENRELKKYKVSAGDASVATKANISSYVAAVDNGYRLSFYDYCANNLKGDRRRKGGSAAEIAADNRDRGIGVMLFGWLIWGLAIYWMFDGGMSVGGCAVVGAIISLILSRSARRASGFTLIILPIILTVLFAK